MATLGEIKDRIIRETDREDLTDSSPGDATAVSAETLTTVIKSAIEYYADERFTFTENRDVTASSTEYTPLPEGLRVLDMLSVTVGTNRYPMKIQSWDVIERWSGYGPANGQPTDFSISGGQARLYPTPNTSYPLTWIGVFDVPVDYDDDNSSNAWTTQGQELIVARARYLLNRDYFRDDAAASIASIAEGEALSSLLGKTAKLIGTGRVKASW